MKTITTLLFLVIQFFVYEAVVRYDNFEVHRIVPTKHDHLNFLQQLEAKSSFNFWKSARALNRNVDIMVPPHLKNEFKNQINQQGLLSEILISNVQHLIDKQKHNKTKAGDFGWEDYHTLQEINVWLSNLAEKYPEIVSLEKAGTSYEGRPIVGVHLSFKPENEKKAVFVESNIHACEWIGSAVSTYILNQLLTSTDPNVREVANNHDWYFFPVVNPDGFSYTHSTDRMWRKTRVPYKDCFGADPNRNWDYHWNEGGSSDDPCTEIYGGPEPFSEPEMKSFSKYLSKIGDNLEGYISFHSFSQILLLPYGYTEDHLDNYDELYEVGLKAIDALSQRYNTQYEIGDVAEILYVASGGSPDWVKGTFGTRITYTYELRDNGTYGFLLPPEQIIPTAEETLDSFITIFQEFAKK